MSMVSRGEYLHFRCAWHAIKEGADGNPRGGFAAKCEVRGCKNRGLAYWYREAKYAELPQGKATNEGE